MAMFDRIHLPMKISANLFNGKLPGMIFNLLGPICVEILTFFNTDLDLT